MTDRLDRSALLASDAPAPEVARQLGISEQRVRQLRAARGDRRPTGRPRTDALTPRSARGAELLARLVAVAEERGVTPEALLDGLESG